VQQRQRGDDLGDLRQAHQAGEADDLDRDLAGGEGVEHVRRVGVVAGQHADLAPQRLVHRGVARDHPLRQPVELVGVGRVHDRADVAVGSPLLGLER